MSKKNNKDVKADGTTVFNKPSTKHSTKLVEQLSTTVQITPGKKEDHLSYMLDLDALFGHMSYDVFAATFQQNVVLGMTSSSKDIYLPPNKIKTKYMVSLANDIRKKPYVKLGECKVTGLGKIDIYFVLLKSELSREELKSMVYITLKESIRKSGVQSPSLFFSSISVKHSKEEDVENLECEVSCKDLFKILKFLFDEEFKDSEPVFYFETFGNKRQTISTCLDFNLIRNKIYSTFAKKAEKYLTVDVCISTSFGDGTVTLANDNLFNAVEILPNHKPLFSNTVLNCSHYCKNQQNKIGVFENCLKANFYSTFKYYFLFDKSPNYIFPVTMELLLSNLFGHRIYCDENTCKDFVSKYKQVQDESTANLYAGTCLYRTEIRCNLLHAKGLLIQLKKFLVPSAFSYYSSIDFFRILGCNINNIIHIFTTQEAGSKQATPDSLILSLISEYVLKTLYITGSVPISAFTREQNDRIMELLPFFDYSIGILKDVGEVAKEVGLMLTTTEKCNLLSSQITYSSDLAPYRKFLLLEIIKCHFSENIDSDYIIMKMLTSYVISKTGDTSSTISLLNNAIETDRKVSIMNMLKQVFTKKTKNMKSTISKIWFSILKEKLAIKDDLKVLSQVIEQMKIEGITTCFTYAAFQRLDLATINYSIASVSVAKKYTEKKLLLKEFIFLCNEKIADRIDEMPESELVRYLHAVYRHSTSISRIKDVLFDFNYGFCPVRKEWFIKNKIGQFRNLVLDEERFIKTMTLVKEWSPDKFSIEERMSYFAEHEIVFSQEIRVKYEELVAIDNEAWWSSDIRFQLEKDSVFEIWFKIVKNNSKYHDLVDIVQTYCEIPIFSFIPVRIIPEELAEDFMPDQFADLSDVSEVFDTILIDENIKAYQTPKKLCLSESGKLLNISTVFADMLVNEKGESVQTSLRESNGDSIFRTPLIRVSRFRCLGDNLIFSQEIENCAFENVECQSIEDIINEEISEENACTEVQNLANETEETGNVFETYKVRVFRLYRYKKFNANIARHSCFATDRRPTVQNWRAFLIANENEGKISNIFDNVYKFNLKAEHNEKYLKYFDVFGSIYSCLKRISGRKATANNLRQCLQYELRPEVQNWHKYISDMVWDKELIISDAEGQEYFNLP